VKCVDQVRDSGDRNHRQKIVIYELTSSGERRNVPPLFATIHRVKSKQVAGVLDHRDTSRHRRPVGDVTQRILLAPFLAVFSSWRTVAVFLRPPGVRGTLVNVRGDHSAKTTLVLPRISRLGGCILVCASVFAGVFESEKRDDFLRENLMWQRQRGG
jgi:hypothetical protein